MVETDGETVAAPDAQFDKALMATRVHFKTFGTDLRLRWQGGTLNVTVGRDTFTVSSTPGIWHESSLAFAVSPTEQDVTLTSELPVLFDSVTVDDRSASYLLSLTIGLPAIAVAIGMLVVLRNRKPNGSPTI